MKVLHVITSLQTGGAEKLMTDLLPRLRDKGIDTEICLFQGKETQFKEDLAKRGIKIIDLSINKTVYNPINILKLIKIIRNGNYDIVHTHNTAPQFFAAIAGLFCSTILCTTEHSTTNRRRSLWWFKPFDRWMYFQYQKIICISNKTEENLRYSIKCKSEKILTINNGIDVCKYYEATPLPIKELAQNCGVALIQVAGFRYQKDQDTAIRALKYLDDNVHLFLIGDGPRRVGIEKLIKKNQLDQRVHLLGIRDDVANLLRGSDIAIMSSHYEGFGLSAVEAMAAGIPVVATNIDGLSQVVQDAGILFEHEDETDLAEKIKKLLNNKDTYNKVVERGIARAMLFDISEMANKYEKVYNSLIKSYQ